MSHEHLLTAVSRGAHEEALLLALAEWKRVPSPGVGDLVDFISGQLPPLDLQWPKATDALQSAWLERGRRPEPAARPALLEALGLKAFDRGDATRFLARLALVARWPADPRTAGALRTLLDAEARRARDGILSGSFLRPLLTALVKQGDSRTRPWLERFISHNPCRMSSLRQELVNLATRSLEKCPVVVDPPWLARLPARSPGKRPQTVDEAYDAVFATPGDRSLRLVLGDLLLEQGDPRGPFFALNLAASERPLTGDEERTCEKLEKKLKKDLLGDLAPITRSAGFEDGFANALVLAATWKSPPRVWQDAFSSKWMSTVRHVDGGEAYEATLREVLEVAPPSLRSVATTSRQLALIADTKMGPRFEGLTVTGRASAAALRQLARFERLQWLDCAGDLDEVTSWLKCPRPLEVVRLDVSGPAHRSVLEGHRATLAAAAEHWFTHTTVPTLEVNDFKLERVEGGVALSWLAEPIWGDSQAWALVALTSSKQLPVRQTAAAFAPAVLNLTPTLKKALGTLLPPGTRRA